MSIKYSLEIAWIRLRTYVVSIALLGCIAGTLLGFYFVWLGMRSVTLGATTVHGITIEPRTMGEMTVGADMQLIFGGIALSVVCIGIVARQTGGLGTAEQPF